MYKPKVRLGKPSVRSAVVVMALLSIALGATGLVLATRSTSPRTPLAQLPVDEQLKTVLAQSTLNSDNLKTIDSSLGFKMAFDPTILDGQGQTTDASSNEKWISGKTYTDEELYERRDYSIVKFQPKKTDNDSENLFAKPEMVVLTNIRKQYWENSMKLPKNAGKTKLEVFMNGTVEDMKERDYRIADSQDVTINSVEYKLVTFEYANEEYGITYRSSYRYYFTIQNDRPYYIALYNVDNDKNGYVAQFETIINTITFEGLDQDKLAAAKQSQQDNVLAATDSLPASTSNIPNALDTKSLIDVVARNQIAVVRIGMVYCTDIELLLAGGSVGGRIEDACAAGIGSGSIVTSDGYIATNGHVVRASKVSALQSYVYQSKDVEQLAVRTEPLLSYLVQHGKLTSSQKDALLKGIKTKQASALQAVLGLPEVIGEAQMAARDDTYTYVVQLSNEPIRFKDILAKRLEFEYSTTNVNARFVSDNYDGMLDAKNVSKSTKSDVALLKMDGQFPVVSLGSIDSISTLDRLIAIGYPAFVDQGLTTTQKHTVPSITQGFAEGIRVQSMSSPYKLVYTTVPLAPGNSGGPMFSEQGVQIGLSTYSLLPCQDKKCFGKGIARDINDLKQLASAQGVVLGESGTLTQEWAAGIEALKQNNYTGAAEKFGKVSSEYHGNYLASALRDVAASQMDGGAGFLQGGTNVAPAADGKQAADGDAQPVTVEGVVILGTAHTPKTVRLVSAALIAAGGAALAVMTWRIRSSKKSKAALPTTQGPAPTIENVPQTPIPPVTEPAAEEPKPQDSNKPT